MYGSALTLTRQSTPKAPDKRLIQFPYIPINFLEEDLSINNFQAVEEAREHQKKEEPLNLTTHFISENKIIDIWDEVKKNPHTITIHSIRKLIK